MTHDHQEIDQRFDSYFEGSYGTGYPVMQTRVKAFLHEEIDRARTAERLDTIEWAIHLFSMNTPENVLGLLRKYAKLSAPAESPEV